jgi:hypothetical protein
MTSDSTAKTPKTAQTAIAAGTVTLTAAVFATQIPALGVVALVAMVAAAVMLARALVTTRDELGSSRGVLVALLVCAGFSGVFLTAEAARPLGISWPLVCLVYLALTPLAVVGSGDGALRRNLAGCGLIATHLALLVTVALTSDPHRDVQVFLTDSARALLHGQNPYQLTFPNIYGPAETAVFYAPGVVQGGVVTVGLPYPPISAIAAIPGYLLGDVRISAVLLVSALAAVMFLRATTPTGRVGALLVVSVPGSTIVVAGGWTEPLPLALLGFAALAAARRQLIVAACLLGLLLTSKQYFVVVLPCLWLLRPYATRGRVLAMLSTAALSTVPFFLWDPGAFWRAIVSFQLIQPFRSDSVSLLVWSVDHLGWPPPSWYGVLPLVAGSLVAAATARWARPGVAPFCVAVGLALLVTVLLSKQAFLNYYFLVAEAFVVAGYWYAEGHYTEAHFAEDRYAARSGERTAYLMGVSGD